MRRTIATGIIALATALALGAFVAEAQKPVYQGSKITSHETSPFVGLVAHSDSAGPMLVALAENGDVYIARGTPSAGAWTYQGNVIDGVQSAAKGRK